MKKKVLSVVLAAVLVFSVFGCSAPAEKEAESEETVKTEETAKAEETEKTGEEDAASEESQELNKYGITDKQLDALVSTVKERVQKEYLEVHGINPAEFTWAEGRWMYPHAYEILMAYDPFLTMGTPDYDSVLEKWGEMEEKYPVLDFEADGNEVNFKDELLHLVADICLNWLAEEEIDYETFKTAVNELQYDEVYADKMANGFSEQEASELAKDEMDIFSMVIRENVTFD